MGTQSPTPKGAEPHPIFGPRVLWPNGWMDEDAAGYRSKNLELGPVHIVLDGVPAPAKGAQQLPSFRPMSIVATVAHLNYC